MSSKIKCPACGAGLLHTLTKDPGGEDPVIVEPEPLPIVDVHNTPIWKLIGLDGPNDKGGPIEKRKMVKWSSVCGRHMKYVGCPKCDRGNKLIVKAVGYISLYVFIETGCQVVIADGSKPLFGNCYIKHNEGHSRFGGSFDTEIHLNQTKAGGKGTRDWTGLGDRPLIDIWDGELLRGSLINWKAEYLLTKGLWLVSAKTQYRSLVNPQIKELICERVKDSYGQAEYDLSRNLFTEYRGHTTHMHRSTGNPGAYDQNFNTILGRDLPTK